MGYERHSPQGYGSGNSRNGTFDKTVSTEVGEVKLRVPRDRDGTFEPQLVPHGVRRLDGLSEQVISLYAKGLTTGDIPPTTGRALLYAGRPDWSLIGSVIPR